VDAVYESAFAILQTWAMRRPTNEATTPSGPLRPDDSFDAASAPMSKGPICSSLPARSPWIMASAVR